MQGLWFLACAVILILWYRSLRSETRRISGDGGGGGVTSGRDNDGDGDGDGGGGDGGGGD